MSRAITLASNVNLSWRHQSQLLLARVIVQGNNAECYPVRDILYANQNSQLPTEY